MSLDAATPQTSDTEAAGTETHRTGNPDGEVLVPEQQSPESNGSAPPSDTIRGSGTEDDKTWQPIYDRLNTQHQALKGRYEGMDDVMEQYNLTGDTAAAALNQYDSILRHPELGATVTEYLRTGQFNAPTTKTTEEIEDEQLEKPWLSDLQPLQEENRVLRSRLEGIQRNTGGQAIERIVSDFLGRHELNDEERPVFQKKMDRYIAGISTDAGLDMIQNPNSKQFEPVMLSFIEEWREDIEARRAETKRRGLNAMATDAPSRVSTTGAESPAAGPVARTKEQIRQNARAAAARAAQRG